MAPRKVSTTYSSPSTTSTITKSPNSRTRALLTPPPSLPRPASSLPDALRFPLLLIFSLTLSSLLYSCVPLSVARQLAGVSRSLDAWTDVALLVGWRAAELGFAWWGGWDALDVAALSVVGRGPTLYLLNAFYGVPVMTTALSLFIDMFTAYLPLRLLRPLSLAHAASATRPVPNVQVLSDTPTTIVTTLLPAAIYATALHLAYSTFLPVQLVMHFDTLSSIEIAHSSTFITLLPVSLVAGYAARVFIFVPATATVAATNESGVVFDPATATLGATFRANVWGWSSRTKVVILRTAVVMAIAGVGTVVQTAGTVEGVDLTGAMDWAAVWAAASAVVGMGLGVCAAV